MTSPTRPRPSTTWPRARRILTETATARWQARRTGISGTRGFRAPLPSVHDRAARRRFGRWPTGRSRSGSRSNRGPGAFDLTRGPLRRHPRRGRHRQDVALAVGGSSAPRRGSPHAGHPRRRGGAAGSGHRAARICSSDTNGGSLDVDADRYERGRVVSSTLRRYATETPVVVAIDDVQWLDPVSAGALRYAFRRLDAEPVLVLATERADPSHSAGRPDDPAGPPRGDLRRAAVPARRRVLVVSSIADTLPRPTLERVHDAVRRQPAVRHRVGARRRPVR